MDHQARFHLDTHRPPCGHTGTDPDFMEQRKYRALMERMDRLREKVRSLRQKLNDLRAVNRTLERQAEARRRLLDQVPTPVLLLQEERILEANRAAHTAVGYESESLTGKRYLSFIHPEEAPSAVSVYRRLLAGKPLPDRYEVRILRRDGTAKPYEVRVAPVRHGGRKAFLLSLWDLERRQEALEARVLEERIKTLRAMGSGVADAMERCLADLEGQGSPDPRSPRVAGEEALRRARDLCEKLRVMGRPLEGEMGVHHASSLVREAVSRALAGIEEVRSEGSKDTVKTYLRTDGYLAGNRDALVAALAAVVANAAEAVGPDGNVYVSAEEEAGRFQVYVQDDGPGITPSGGLRVFDPFYSSGQGFGLGLTLAQSVLEAHGGGVSFRSKRGGGTTFTVQLPMSPTPPPMRAGRPRKSIKGLTVVVVTEEDLVGHLLCRHLSSAGARVHLVNGAPQCLRVLEKKGAGAVLLDLRQNGPAFATALPAIARRDPRPAVGVILPVDPSGLGDTLDKADLVLAWPLLLDRVPERLAQVVSELGRSG